MSLDTYTNLKAAIIDELDRAGDPDLSSRVDDFIDLAESLHRDGDDDAGVPPIRFRGMIARAQSDFADRYLALPIGFLQMETLRLFKSNGAMFTISQVDLDELNRRRRPDTKPGVPCIYAIHEEIEFDRVPNEVLTAEMIYYKELTPLSDADQTNALLIKSPGCYLYGALQFSAPWLSEDERVPTWNSAYRSACSGLVRADRKSRHGGPLVTRVAGPTP